MRSIADVNNPSQDELRELLTDKLLRLNSLYWIRDKAGKIVPFRLNQSQINFLGQRHNRNVIPKSRQRGFTTLAVINRLDDCLFIPNFEAGIIAHSLDDAKSIFEKAKVAFERLPEWVLKYRMPETDTADTYKFPNGSRFSVDTSFRSRTLSSLHVSEMAKIAKKFPEKAKEIITGAFEAVPLDGFIDVESTGEGMDGAFFDLCEAAAIKSDKELTALDFKLYFEPWWTADEYRLSPMGITIEDDLKAYFEALARDHGIKLDDSQKAWYKKKRDTLDELVKQEYPSVYEEVFMASGRPVFSQEKLAADIRKAKEKSFKRGFVLNGEFKEQDRGGLFVFQMPKEGEAYSIGADVAEGLEDGDYSTACVLNKNFEQVAVFKGHLDPDLFGKLLVEMGKFYNQALLTPELNNHGHATIAAIKNEHYYNVWRREITDEIADDKTDKLGWLTNVKTKMKMLDDFKASYRDGSLKLWHEETLREMRTITFEEDGNVTMNSKDLCVATGLAIQGLSQTTAPGSLGTFESGGRKAKFKSLTEMLEYNTSNEESYFD
jgi:hypothetical protein